MFDRDFFSGKKVLITGHTGFKGTWRGRSDRVCVKTTHKTEFV